MNYFQCIAGAKNAMELEDQSKNNTMVYVNPTNLTLGQTKQDWLNENGTRLLARPNIDDYEEGAKERGVLPVCLVDNGPFKAAGVAFDRRQLERFLKPDERPQSWYLVSIETIREHSNVNDYEGILDWIEED